MNWIKHTSGLLLPPNLPQGPALGWYGPQSGDCSCCKSGLPCLRCSGGKFPTAFLVAISGITGDANANGEFIVDEIAYLGDNPISCRLEHNDSATICGGGARQVGVRLYEPTSGSYRLEVTIWNRNGFPYSSVVFGHNFGTTKPDCLSWDELSLAYSAGDSFPGCLNPSSATCLVTSL